MRQTNTGQCAESKRWPILIYILSFLKPNQVVFLCLNLTKPGIEPPILQSVDDRSTSWASTFETHPYQEYYVCIWYAVGIVDHSVKKKKESPAERCTDWKTHYHRRTDLSVCEGENISVYISIEGTWAWKLEQIITNIMYVGTVITERRGGQEQQIRGPRWHFMFAVAQPVPGLVLMSFNNGLCIKALQKGAPDFHLTNLDKWISLWSNSISTILYLCHKRCCSQLNQREEKPLEGRWGMCISYTLL